MKFIVSEKKLAFLVNSKQWPVPYVGERDSLQHEK